ncbi:MAG TPA: hypothetical protein VFJ43_11035 [Bacteroidia bacterium]|nr:hypothetical protein [Bacteroidia bacterium]
MRKTLFPLLLLLPLLAHTQNNLVPNPGFEDYKQIPCSYLGTDMNSYLDNWDCASDGTADFITDLAGADCYANPNSTESQGKQTPHGGHGMAFIYNYNDMDYREYVAVKLKSPLIVGQTYSAEMFVSLADYSGLASNNIGICFFTGELRRSSGYKIYGDPQVNSDAVITNYTDWTKVSGTFVADKAYTYLVIGNFSDGGDTKTSKNTAPDAGIGGRGPYAGYYIDDVVVKTTKNMLAVTGDTLVAAGTIATLDATGGNTYKWANAQHPQEILGTDAELKIPVKAKTTFVVFDDNGNSKKITVNVTTPPVYMQTLNGRKVKKGQVVKVHNEKVKITVYDNNKIDGDSISLYYGDSCIVSNLALTGKKKTYTITIDKTHPRQLILYAVNLGEQPPNTAAIIISDGSLNINVMLSSDLKSSDAVMLSYVASDQ